MKLTWLLSWKWAVPFLCCMQDTRRILVTGGVQRKHLNQIWGDGNNTILKGQAHNLSALIFFQKKKKSKLFYKGSVVTFKPGLKFTLETYPSLFSSYFVYFILLWWASQRKCQGMITSLLYKTSDKFSQTNHRWAHIFKSMSVYIYVCMCVCPTPARVWACICVCPTPTGVWACIPVCEGVGVGEGRPAITIWQTNQNSCLRKHEGPYQTTLLIYDKSPSDSKLIKIWLWRREM